MILTTMILSTATMAATMVDTTVDTTEGTMDSDHIIHTIQDIILHGIADGDMDRVSGIIIVRLIMEGENVRAHTRQIITTG